MQIELASLMSNVGQAVQQAQAQLEHQAVENFCGYFSPDLENSGDADVPPTLSPICRRFSLSDTANGPRQVEAPVAALVHHNTLSLDTVQIHLNILPQLEDSGQLLVEVGPSGKEVDPAYSRLELTFRLAPAAEGVARLSQSTMQFL